MKKISERADELYQKGQESDFYGRKNNEISLLTALGVALDEWQASVDERLAKDPARLALAAVFAAACPGGDSKIVNELLERAGIAYRVQEYSSIPHSIEMIMLEAGAKGLMPLRANERIGVRIEDPGPSRYDSDPSEPKQ